MKYLAHVEYEILYSVKRLPGKHRYRFRCKCCKLSGEVIIKGE